MTFQEAIVFAHNGTKTAVVIQAIHDEVEPLCKTETGSEIETSLYDWLEAGIYDSDETPQSIATEWDELSQD